MKRQRVVLVAAVGVALALPARAYAVDHAVLIISPTKLAAHPAWNVHARIVDAAYAGQETFGVSLTRSFLKGRAEEQHEFAPASERTFTFDGQRGLWEAALGVVGGRSNAVTVKMDITATGAPQPVGESQGCRGDFVQVPVALQGTFALRTGTRFFKTIRRSSFTGVVIFNPGGRVDCTPLASTECSAKLRSLSFSQALARSSSAQVLMGTDQGGWMSLAFADRPVVTSPWYHVMRIRGFNPLSGQLPTISTRIPTKLPIRGSGTFAARSTSTETNSGCQTISATGSFKGTFHTSFAGWGPRKFAASSANGATYREDR
jgi:hypothetical protein